MLDLLHVITIFIYFKTCSFWQNTKLLASNENENFSNAISEKHELDQLVQKQNVEPSYHQEMITQKKITISNICNEMLAGMKVNQESDK